MYRLLIADDEPLVKERLTKTIPWKDFGISQVLTAADGKKPWTLPWNIVLMLLLQIYECR